MLNGAYNIDHYYARIMLHGHAQIGNGYVMFLTSQNQRRKSDK